MKGCNPYLSKVKFVIFLLFICCDSSDSNKLELSLPAIFSDHMVLQQKESVTFWGKSSPNQEVNVRGSWGSSSSSISDSIGNWQLNLSTPQAGGPYKIKIKTPTESIQYKDVLIGEVWLASGQSNMGMIIDADIENKEEEIKNANYSEIRFFSILEDLTGESFKNQKWVSTTPENAKNYSAAAYFFARELSNELKIPIGIISSSWGGTKVESWISNKKLKTFDQFKGNVPKSIDEDIVHIERLKYNDSIAKVNEDQFGLLTFDLPKPYYLWNEKIVWNVDLWNRFSQGWTDLNLNDNEYKNIDFDDSKWDYISKSMVNNSANPYTIRFDSIFKTNEQVYESFNDWFTTVSSGVIWLRIKAKIEDIKKDYVLIVDKGIDHIDQTFFNEELIGNTFSIDGRREYKIPQRILKKGENLIAIRITNLGGDGGLNSSLLIENSDISREIPYSNFQFKHHAFLTNGSSVLVHNYSFKDLLEKRKKISNNLSRGYIVNSPYGNSISFEKLISPIIPFTIKGVIWYQGEANVGNYNEYQELFIGMIDDWREKWGYDFPLYYAQLAPYIYSKKEPSHELRDAQRKTLQSTDNTGMAVLMDVGEEDNIHAPNKQDVGKRLALLALDNNYGFDIVSSGPLYKNHKNFKNYIEVDFKNKGSGLDSTGELKDFEIAGDDNVFYDAYARIVNNKVRVSSNKVRNPKHVRYGWKNWIIGTLFNKEGLPASSFSSQN